jgi:hypothetical protein
VITGVHAIVFSPNARKVRTFFADMLNLPSVDAGGGWLIFALPPAELAVHPADGDRGHELYLMCVTTSTPPSPTCEAKAWKLPAKSQIGGWGLLAAIRLPDGAEFPLYQPRHPSPPQSDRAHSHAALRYVCAGPSAGEPREQVPGPSYSRPGRHWRTVITEGDRVPATDPRPDPPARRPSWSRASGQRCICVRSGWLGPCCGVGVACRAGLGEAAR